MKDIIKGTVWTLGAITIIAILVVVWRVVMTPLFFANTAIDAGQGVVQKTVNADNILTNYEMFKDLYNGAKQQAQNIQNTQVSIESLQKTYGADATKYPKDVRDNLQHLNETLDGLKMQYERTVSDYNSNSTKLNRNLFKDKQLPYQLPLDYTQLN